MPDLIDARPAIRVSDGIGAAVEHLFSRHGHHILGVAHTSIVYAPSDAPDLAIKIGVDADDGWPAWAEWCRGNPSPHVPRVHEVEWLTVVGRRRVFVAAVERLFPAVIGGRWIRACPLGKRDPLVLADHVEVRHPSVAHLLREAAAAFPHGHWDIGGPNILERDDGTLVLNDPLSRA